MATEQPIRIPARVEDLRGRHFGRLVVLAYADVRAVSGRKYHYWLCSCSCTPASRFLVRGESLRGGNTTSCGCRKREAQERGNYKHGRTGSKEHHTWSQMRQRCHNPRHPRYADWGGRGIFVCDEWRRSFPAFLRDMGEAPSPRHTIERIDNDGPYRKGNCRWAPAEEQARNTRKNRRLTFRGRTMILADWAREVGLRPDIVETRLRRGWSVEDALSVPDSGFGGSRKMRGRNGPRTTG
jgi:hypothetical protein